MAKRTGSDDPDKKARKTSKKTAKKTAKKASKKASARGAQSKARKAADKAGGRSKKATPDKAGKATHKAARKRKAKPKSHLNKKELKEMRELLLDKRRDLVGDMSGMESGSLHRARQEGSGDLSSIPTHPADIGSDNYEQEFTLGLLESERILLNEIDEALERIAEGTFGICLGTGKPIAKPRLKARPWAKYCIDYARLIEKGLVDPDAEDNGLYGSDEEE